MLPLLTFALIVQGRVLGQDGQGMPGVEVSNGSRLAVTSADGGYSIAAEEKDYVFVIQPSGWQAVPRFYRPASVTVDFTLRPVQQSDNFQALVLTDPQPANPKEVGYLARSLGAPLGRLRRPEWKFLLTLGDVTYDRPDLYPEIAAALRPIGLPWYAVNGNHDLALGIAGEGAIGPYEAAMGPSTYAFHYGHALFIALNDVRHLGGPQYLGGMLPSQWPFLEALLGRTPRDELTVLFFHIPLFSPDPSNAETFRRADRDRLFALLQDHPHVLLLSGHTHYQRHVFYGPKDGWHGAAPLEEDNIAAACGGYWGGPPDPAGVPVATMSDGTPPGYAVLTVHGTQAFTAYYPRPALGADQIALHIANAIAPRQGYVSCYANVFDGHEGWTVESRIDGRAWAPMKSILGWDPTYADAYLAQDRADVPPGHVRLPDLSICYHLWRAYLPPDLTLGEHLLEVRAAAPDGRRFTSRRSFRIANSPARRPP